MAKKTYKPSPRLVRSQDLDASDLVLDYNQALGPNKVAQLMAETPWLGNAMAKDWPGFSDSPYIEAYAATARIILTAARLGSIHPSDLACALNLPFAMVCVVLLGLQYSDWKTDLLPDLTVRLDKKSCDSISRVEVTNFLTSNIVGQVDFLDVLRAVGLSLL